MDSRYRENSWNENFEFKGESWDGYDLTNTDFANVIFERVVFKNCLFHRTKVENMRTFGCSFLNCGFEKVVFKGVAIGADGDAFRNCMFTDCDFRGQYFFWPLFEECQFSKCKFNGANFNDSTFSSCKFTGMLRDVSFNGMYHRRPTNRQALDRVDFRNAIFGEFVTFYDCDLSNCLPPAGTTFDEALYNVYSNDSTVLSTGSKDRIVLERRFGENAKPSIS